MRYAVVLEKTDDGYSAYVPDVPGCITVSDTAAETLRHMAEALTGHLEVMTESGEKVPDPSSLVEYVDVPLPMARGKTKTKSKVH